jgi:hypothetical protein
VGSELGVAHDDVGTILTSLGSTGGAAEAMGTSSAPSTHRKTVAPTIETLAADGRRVRRRCIDMERS